MTPGPLYMASLVNLLQEIIDEDNELSEAIQTAEGRMALFRAMIAVAADVLAGPEDRETIVWHRTLDATEQAREMILAAWTAARAEGN